MASSVIDQIEALIRRDPAGRGLISKEAQLGPLCSRHLAQAAENLASAARHVAIVTGFFVPDAELPAAETDGPPGAVVLAMALEAAGIRTTLVTDRLCASAVCAAARAAGGGLAPVEVCTQAIEWFDDFVNREAGSQLTHLIAVERVGPSHDEQSSLASQLRSGLLPHPRYCRNLRHWRSFGLPFPSTIKIVATTHAAN